MSTSDATPQKCNTKSPAHPDELDETGKEARAMGGRGGAQHKHFVCEWTKGSEGQRTDSTDDVPGQSLGPQGQRPWTSQSPAPDGPHAVHHTRRSSIPWQPQHNNWLRTTTRSRSQHPHTAAASQATQRRTLHEGSSLLATHGACSVVLTNTIMSCAHTHAHTPARRPSRSG